uniref:Uncharacterized protein n=1 Tax=Nephromyces sp. ex Molgula occidentalis TaxID=2544991 RepID=A0A5C1H847_9APIC|nr:hypothetical protein [Nephromyces sp. ex Molgula occidentalis]
MIVINSKNKKIFYTKKFFNPKYKINNNLLYYWIPNKSKIEYTNLNFDKNKLKSSFFKGIIVKKRKTNLIIKSNIYIKLPVWNPKIKNIKFF